MRKKISIYRKDEKGEMFLLKGNITQDGATIIRNNYYRKTGRATVIVYSR